MPNPRKQRRTQRKPKDAYGSSEVTQARLTLTPTFGPTVRIMRSAITEWQYDATATDRNFSIDWSLSDVPSSTEFTNLFSQWRLTKGAVTITWLPNDGVLAAPRVFFGIDPFDTVTKTFTSLQERPHRAWSPTPFRNVLQLTTKPRVISLAAAGPHTLATVGNSLAPVNAWYDTANAALAYGKMWFFITGFGNVGRFVVKQDYFFEFRGTK